ncbi:MAG: hypothetical protein MZV63_22130, partial [Marinilabiliales bacterium]|nr:hypothetical protein [Marinilabiliales bacterium]
LRIAKVNTKIPTTFFSTYRPLKWSPTTRACHELNDTKAWKENYLAEHPEPRMAEQQGIHQDHSRQRGGLRGDAEEPRSDQVAGGQRSAISGQAARGTGEEAQNCHGHLCALSVIG